MSGQWLRWSTRFEIAITIGKSSYPIGISDVQIVRIIPRRIKCDPKRLVQAVFDECFDDVRFSAAFGIAQRLDSVCPAFYDEDVAIGGGEQKTRITETAGVNSTLKPGGTRG